MKTLRLIESYIRNIVEQDELEAQDAAMNDVAPREVSSNEKYIIKILANALIFNPAKFPDRRENIFKDIESLRRSPNQPISAIIRKIKNIISLDRSLVIESDTDQLFKHYAELLERNSLDATEPQLDDEPSIDNSVEPAADPSIEVDVDLDEIFPLYQDMILNALSYEPSSRDLMMLRDVINGVGEDDPLNIVDTVQGIMSSRRSEEDVADDLTEI